MKYSDYTVWGTPDSKGPKWLLPLVLVALVVGLVVLFLV